MIETFSNWQQLWIRVLPIAMQQKITSPCFGRGMLGPNPEPVDFHINFQQL